MHGVHLLLLWLDAGMLPLPFGYRFLCCVLLRTLTLHARPAAIYEIFAIFRDYTTKGPLLVYAVCIARHGATRSLCIVKTVKLGQLGASESQASCD
ncbi:hypothetical protein B0H65DRAFT_546495 [Neurospora tetraspora]|uniref:Uncharacterized protein n=1 Tax=Neurospora tetraspora TaxID=94610 RepID=A0AAE0MUE8_9PEZI|nr:hypothetical protein B0H65DRAFT_546495 [Neurospora tetraspora]